MSGVDHSSWRSRQCFVLRQGVLVNCRFTVLCSMTFAARFEHMSHVRGLGCAGILRSLILAAGDRLGLLVR